MSLRVATVLGARPQFVKAAAVSPALGAAGITEILIHTGQHYDAVMSAVFFEELGLSEPEHHLEVGSGPHGEQTGRMLERLERVLQDDPPDRVLVFGDTNTTLAGALAAAKLHIPLAHVEAGLRSFNRSMPEELNRVLTDHAADLLFTPTRTAVANLHREGIPPERIIHSGDVMYDVALRFGERAERESGILEEHGLTPKGYALATVHRAETTDDPNRLAGVVAALDRIAASLPVVWPIHPRAAGRLDGSPAGVTVIDPVGYLDMARLEQAAAVVVTDSGGVQKEAFFHRVPCVTVRTETEWVELVELGWNRLADPSDPEEVVAAVEAALGSTPDPAASPYGDGRAGEVIARALAGPIPLR